MTVAPPAVRPAGLISVEPADGFIDTHVHFWDHDVDGLRWRWLEPGFSHGKVAGTGSLDAPRYTVPEFHAETRARAWSASCTSKRWTRSPTSLSKPDGSKAWPTGTGCRARSSEVVS